MNPLISSWVRYPLWSLSSNSENDLYIIFFIVLLLVVLVVSVNVSRLASNEDITHSSGYKMNIKYLPDRFHFLKV